VREKVRGAFLWVVAGPVALSVVCHQQLFGLATPTASTAQASGPVRDMALAGGGVSDNGRCGPRAFHYFAVSVVTDTGGMLPGTPAGPAVVLGAYGTE